MTLRIATLRGEVRLPFALSCIFFATLWIAGGASRPGLWGQVITRGGAWLILIIAILWAEWPKRWPAKPVTLLLSLTIALVAIQLVPLPPAIWQALPGRALLSEAAIISQQPQPWRPLAIAPAAAWNALSSLVVPVTVLVLASCLRRDEHERILVWTLLLVVASMAWGMLQFAGADLSNPLINQTPGAVSANFANRNHLALLLAIGCLLAPSWASAAGRHRRVKLIIAFALIVLFALAILATGSRAGLLLCLLALGLDLWVAGREVGRAIRGLPRLLAYSIISACGVILSALVGLTIMFGRAESINRLMGQEPAGDLRARAFPTLLNIAWSYFPCGSGFGSFDPVFRLHEPLSLLNLSYLNHAHNDFLEIAIEGGLPALLLLAGAVAWWGLATLRLACTRDSGFSLARLGSALLLVTMVASLFDYPVRTPIIMALVTLAAFWLARSAASALPLRRQSL